MKLAAQKIPDLSRAGLRAEDKINLLFDYTQAVERELRYVLEHLDAENLSTPFAGSLQSTQRSVQRMEQADYDQQLARRVSEVDVVNHLVQTEPGKVLDARQGRALDAKKLDKNALLDAVYPVGSLYMSVNSTSPAELFGGAWERIQDCFLLAAGTTYEAGITGGEASHTLTAQEMPLHAHRAYPLEGKPEYRFSMHRTMATGATGYGFVCNNATSGLFTLIANLNGPTSDGLSDIAEAEITAYTGGDAAHNNLPPYLAVNVWKRTA